MNRRPNMRAAILAGGIGLALVAAAGTGAVAASKITGDEIAKNTITAKNLAAGSVGGSELKPGVVRDGQDGATGPQGPQGATGERGSQGERGPAGQTGSPGAAGGIDEYVTWTFHHHEDDPRDSRGQYPVTYAATTINGPATIVGVDFDLPEPAKQWFASHCIDGGTGASLGGATASYSAGMPFTLSSGGTSPGYSKPYGTTDALAADEDGRISSFVSCYDDDTDEFDIPDFDATVTFGVVYLTVSSARRVS